MDVALTMSARIGICLALSVVGFLAVIGVDHVKNLMFGKKQGSFEFVAGKEIINWRRLKKILEDNELVSVC